MKRKKTFSFALFSLIRTFAVVMKGYTLYHISETDSTNRWIRDHADQQGCLVAWADFQHSGRGQGSNRWESERGKNLTFSILLHPEQIPAIRQFQISMAVSIAVCDALSRHIADLSIKWPNDIYWRDQKLGGILIENRLKGPLIRDSIIGIGLNVNQQHFTSDAPNPVSIWQICKRETDLEPLLDNILQNVSRYLEQDVKPLYMSMLYRRKGVHPYANKSGSFLAEIADVEDDGHLLLRDKNGQLRRYAFKEVQFII